MDTTKKDVDNLTDQLGKFGFTEKDISTIEQHNKEIDNQLKAIKESTTESAFTFTSWNIKHGNKGTADQTRELLNLILQGEYSDIIALQESVWKESNMTKKHVSTQDFINENPAYSYQGVETEAGFLYRHSKFTCEKIVLEPYPGTFDPKELTLNEIFEKRCCFARFKVKTSNQIANDPDTLTFDIISYHGSHKGIDNYQKRIINTDFLLFIKSHQEQSPFPIFVVGDFNYDLDNLLNNSLLDGMIIPIIDEDVRAKKAIDFLTYFKHTCFWRGNFKDVKCRVYGKDEKYEGMTNHYPLQAMLTFNQVPPMT